MLSLIRKLDREAYTPCMFLVADSDTTSIPRVMKDLNISPESLSDSKAMTQQKQVSFHRIRRSREVGQSWVSTVFTTLVSLFDSCVLYVTLKPDLILCNGPGTCVPICLVSVFSKAMWLHQSKLVFVESFCRVKSLSMTGKLLYFLADRFLVQWPELDIMYRRAEYIGSLF